MFLRQEMGAVTLCCSTDGVHVFSDWPECLEPCQDMVPERLGALASAARQPLMMQMPTEHGHTRSGKPDMTIPWIRPHHKRISNIQVRQNELHQEFMGEHRMNAASTKCVEPKSVCITANQEQETVTPRSRI